MTKTYDNIIEAGIIFLIIFTPLAFGSVYAWAYSIMELVVIFLMFIWLLKFIFHGDNTRKTRFFDNPLLIPLLFFLAFIAIQMMPLPRSFVEVLSPNTGRLYQLTGVNDNTTWATLSIYRHATMVYFLKILAYAGVFFLITDTVKTPDRAKRIAMTIIMTGAFISLIALLQIATGTKKIYWFWQPLEKQEGISVMISQGPYVNRNHFGGYMEMVIPLFLSFLIPQLSHYYFVFSDKENWRVWLQRFSSILSKNMLLLFMLIVMAYTFLFSLTRGGIISFFISMFFFANALIHTNRYKKGYAKFLVSLFMFFAFFMIWFGFGPVVDRMSTMTDLTQDGSFISRLTVFRDALNIIIDYPIFGVGLGNFQTIFPYYQSQEFAHLFWDHAHNDYIEFFSDMGIIGFGFIVWGAVLFTKTIIKGLSNFDMKVKKDVEIVQGTSGRAHRRSRRHSTYKGISFFNTGDARVTGNSIFLGSITGVIAIVFHSFSDFNLQIPANALLFTILCALAISMAKMNIDPNIQKEL